MRKELLNKLNSVDKKVFKIMIKGINFAEVLAIIGILLLYIYNTYYISYNLYLSSLIVFKTSILIAVSFVVCGFATNEIKNQL